MTEPYRVMARRWRPEIFQEVVGQEAVVRTLRNALAQHRLAHALLFTGPRGVGKTSTARLLAKALNCVRGETSDPCGACDSCLAVEDGRLLNVLEIDGASNNRVEEARDLIETVQYAAGPGRWRMVIVDEVHMLSTAAFNALLKTLEEPPPNVVFVLATTEPHKVPATIHSRCQRHDFRRLTAAEIATSLEGRLRQEAAGPAVGGEALAAIARAAQGSLRDGQTLLEQVLAYAGPNATLKDVEDCLGLVRADRLMEVVEAILGRAPGRALELVGALHGEGHDLRLVCQELVAHFRDVAVAKVCGSPDRLLGDSRVPPEALRQQAQRLSLAEIEVALKALLAAEREMRRAPAPRLALEMALIRLGELRSLEPVPQLVARLQELERRLGAGAAPPGAASPAPPELPLFAPPALAAPVETAPGGPADVEAGWRHARQLLAPRKRLATVLAASEAALRGETLEVMVQNGSGFVREALEDPEARRVVAEAVREAFGARLHLRYQYGGGRAAASPAAERPAVRLALELFEGRIAARDEAGAAR
jgi:DNA polymerase-3 subunit gamma/tau